MHIADPTIQLFTGTDSNMSNYSDNPEKTPSRLPLQKQHQQQREHKITMGETLIRTVSRDLSDGDENEQIDTALQKENANSIKRN